MPENNELFRSSIALSRSANSLEHLSHWVSECEKQATDLVYMVEVEGKEELLNPKQAGWTGRVFHAVGSCK